jgi:hypothetical protein
LLARPTPGVVEVSIVGDATRTGVRLIERATGAIPAARLEVVRGSLDPSNLYQLEEFNRLLGGFLERIGW